MKTSKVVLFTAMMAVCTLQEKVKAANTVQLNTSRTMSFLLANNVGGSGVGGRLGAGDAIIVGQSSLLSFSNITLTIDATAGFSVSSIRLGDSYLLGAGGDNGILTFSGAFTLTVTGNVTLGDLGGITNATGAINMAAGGTLQCGGIVIGSAGAAGVGAFTPGTGTIEFTASNTLVNHANYNTYNNVTVSAGTTTLSRNPTAFTGNILLSGTTGKLDVAAANNGITMSGAGTTWTNNNTTLGLGAFNYRTGTVTFSGNVTVNGSANTDFYNVAISGTLNGNSGNIIGIQGTSWSNTNTFTHGSGTVDFKGAVVMGGSVTNTTFNNIIVSGTLTAGFNPAATLQVVGDWTNTGTFTHNTSTVIFDGTGAQALAGTTNPNFYRVTVNKTAGTLTQTNATVSISNLLTMTAGTFDVQTNTLNGAGNITAAGGAANTSLLRLGKIAGTPTEPEMTGVANTVAGGTIELYGAGNQNVKAMATSATNQFFNLLISGSGTKTVNAGGIYVGGDLTISAGSLDVAATNENVKLAGNWINNATFVQRSGTVFFDGTSTVSGSTTTTFYNLTINATHGLTGASSMVMTHDWTNNGTYTHASGLVTFDGTSTIFGTQTTSFYDVTINAAKSLTSLLSGNVNIADVFQNDGTFSHNSGTITFNGPGGAIRGGTVPTTFNHLTIDPVGILSGHPTNYNVVGDWTNNNSYNANGAKVTFNGGGAQAYGGTVATTFHNVDVNKAGGTITMNQDATIDNTGVLNLMAGSVTINKHTITVNNSATAAIIRTTGYLISEDASNFDATHANNSSYVTWAIGATAGAHVYPFGTSGGVYIPFTYTLTAGNAGSVTLATYHTAATNLLMPISVTSVCDTTFTGLNASAYAVDRFWGISSAGGTADMTFGYDDHAAAGDDINSLTGGESGTDGTGLRAQQWDPTFVTGAPGGAVGTWKRYYNPAQTHSVGGNTVKIPGFSGALSSSKPWTLALRVHPLPVSLLNFKVSLNGGKEALINWQTAQEVNSKSFVVERSKDGVNFTAIGELAAAGNSQVATSYNMVDEDPYEGISYYRLKQIDNNGSYTYSALVPLTNASFIEQIKIFPNPAEYQTKVEFKSNEAMPVVINIFDEMGKIVKQEHLDVVVGFNNYVLDVSTLNPGMYRFLLTSSTKEDMKYEGKFLKK